MFEKVMNHSLHEVREKVEQGVTSLAECQTLCRMDSVCHGVDFDVGDSKCYLVRKKHALTDALKPSTSGAIHHYFKSCKLSTNVVYNISVTRDSSIKTITKYW